MLNNDNKGKCHRSPIYFSIKCVSMGPLISLSLQNAFMLQERGRGCRERMHAFSGERFSLTEDSPMPVLPTSASPEHRQALGGCPVSSRVLVNFHSCGIQLDTSHRFRERDERKKKVSSITPK